MTRKEEITRESWKRYPNSPERNYGTGDYEYPEFHDAEREAFEEGAEWEHNRFVDKACEWMMNFKNGNGEFPLYDYVGNFRKAMEE